MINITLDKDDKRGKGAGQKRGRLGGGDVHYLAQRDGINTDDQNERNKKQIKQKLKLKELEEGNQMFYISHFRRF